jgi:long-chain acyl-CoA synthetase
MSNLATNLTASAAKHPNRPALVFGGSAISYRELDESSARVAALLGTMGFVPGDRVGIMLPNVPEFAVAYYGVLRAGGVVVPMNVLLKGREVGFYLKDPGAKIVFAWHGFAEDAQAGAADAGSECVLVEPAKFAAMLADQQPSLDVVDRTSEDTAVILYTSGTTGTPKGAELTHSNLGRNVEVMIELLSLTESDVILGALPLFHSFGQTAGLNSAVASGASLALIPRFDPSDALAIIEREGVTVFQGVPTMFGAVLNHPELGNVDASSLRLCVSGGASLPVELMRAFEVALGCVILEGYGLSETSPVASFNHADNVRKPGSIGTPVRGVEMKLLDVTDEGIGEIAIRGHNVMKGYWNRPEATAEAIDADGWFRSGDLARVDEDGCYFIVDRSKDLIIRGGYNVYPREIEEVLYEHPAVLEAAVVGFPHDELGEEVAAAVAVKAGAEVTANELREFVKEQVAAYKYPRVLWLVDELPKGPTGKILKREISVPQLDPR